MLVGSCITRASRPQHLAAFDRIAGRARTAWLSEKWRSEERFGKNPAYRPAKKTPANTGFLFGRASPVYHATRERAGFLINPREIRSTGVSKLGEVAEGGRGAEDLGAVGCEQARHLGHRRHHHVGRGLGAGDRGTEGDEELLDPRRADRREDACALRVDDVGVRDVAWGEEEVARGDVDPLVADEESELALEDVERLVLVVVDVQRGPAAARVVDLDLREGVAGLGAGDLDGDSAGLPPDIGEALARRDAVGLGSGLDHLFVLLRVVVLVGRRDSHVLSIPARKMCN